MKIEPTRRLVGFAALAMIALFCRYQTAPADIASGDTALTASTPCDSFIRSALGIPQAPLIDFIRWRLVLSEDMRFSLHIHFGEGKPNTNGFKNGGEKRLYQGTFVIEQSKAGRFAGEVYRLRSADLPGVVSMARVGDRLFHLLDADDRLLTGNGGWSYTLNYERAKSGATAQLPASLVRPDTALRVVFDGRTPCLDFAGAYGMQTDQACIKLKWRLILHRDPQTRQPTRYQLTQIRYNPVLKEGAWEEIKGYGGNAEAIVYRLKGDKPADQLLFFKADDNVLFFLDPQGQWLTGNEDFSYTLNRMKGK